MFFTFIYSALLCHFLGSYVTNLHFFTYLCISEGDSVSVLPLLRIGVGEESPGSTGNPTSESRSCRRRQVSVEENNRHASCVVRVRRWCKRPPAGGRSSGCTIWGLQVHVYHRLRASRPTVVTMEGRMLEVQGDLHSR